ncbi:MAG: hypothetical protein RL148_966, partial [Planctomycetota bacterium]
MGVLSACRRSLVSAAYIVVMACPLAAQDPPRMNTAVGAHYDVGSQVSAADAAERLALLESAWPQFVRFCDREPKLAGPLKVRAFANNDQWQKGMQAAGAGP